MKGFGLAAALLICALPAMAEEIHCPGAYDGHLQGIAVDSEGNIYWSFTSTLVKTDAEGTLLGNVEAPSHHGDLWADGGMVYSAVNHRAPGGGLAARVSWIYAYNANDLSFAWKKEIPEVTQGAGGLAMRDGHFFVVSGRLLKGDEKNYVYEYDEDCAFIKRHLLESGPTTLGIQTVAYAASTWWFGCYGTPRETLRARQDLTFEERFPFDCSVGIAPIPTGGFYIGHNEQNEARKDIGWVTKVDQPKAEGDEAGATE